ncbi:hypothetical protein [Pseudonocardia oroxyli]|uniref:hypothetical protein n=1 Tax=Pseudonocardia oroxyli TaxID=366584 RepID=UPI000B817C4F|nr:hypothetical protein [Pseudonocardia oroxyli]
MTSTLTASRARALPALFATVLTALVARVGFLAWEPRFPLRPEDLTAAYWPANLYVGGPAFLLTFLGTAVFLVVLARGVLAWAAGVLVAAGGILFSLVIVAEALPYAYAVGDPAEVERVNQATAALVPTIVGTQVAIGLGVAIGLVGMLVARSVPRWFPIVGLLYLVVFFALPVDLGLPGELAQTALLVGIGWFAVRR